jgi:hypothetical protein
VFSVGMTVGAYCFWAIEINQLIVFEPKITLGEFTNAIATLIAAAIVTVLVSFFIEKHNQADRTEKELLLSQLDVILDKINDFEKANDGGLLIEIAASHKRLSTITTESLG